MILNKNTKFKTVHTKCCFHKYKILINKQINNAVIITDLTVKIIGRLSRIDV